jgi:hypothetical protein
MPSNVAAALAFFIAAAGILMLALALWLFVCDCQHRIWGAAGLNSLVAIHSTVCPAGDSKALAQLRMRPDRLA